MFAIKIAQAAGYRVILTSSSDKKLRKIQAKFTAIPILTFNYTKPKWHEEVLRLTDGAGVDLVLGTAALGLSCKVPLSTFCEITLYLYALWQSPNE